MLSDPFLRKPNGEAVAYEPRFWSRLGAQKPSLFMPMFGPARAGVADYSSNGNDGTVVSGATWTPSPLGMATSFNGSSGYVSIPDAPAFHFGAGEVSVILWVNTNTPSTTTYVWFATSTTINGVGISLSINNSGTFNCRASDGTHLAASSVSSFNNSKWRQAGLILNRTTNKMIPVVDGILQTSAANSTSTVTTTTNTSGSGVGALAGGGGSTVMKGQIASVLVFPFALNAAQVWKLYTQPWAMFSRRDARFGTAAAAVSRPGFIIGGGVGFFPMAA